MRRDDLRTFASVIALAFAILPAAGALAAEQTTPPTPPAAPATPSSDQAATTDSKGVATLNEVVVTGFRKSLADALQDKKSASAIVDTIAAEDIGKFPEQNLAESLQRITGVQIQRNNGEGQYVSIRGLDPKFAQVDLDGDEMPSPTGTRSFDYGILAAEFVSAVEVYKTPTANLTEGGLAGTANVRTIDPDSVRGQQLTLVAKGNDDLDSGSINPHVTVLYTNKFFDDKLGVVAGYDYNQSHYRYDSYAAYGMEPYVGATGSGTNGLVQNWNPGGNQNTPYLFDNAQSLGEYDGQRTRDTYILSLSYRPIESLEFYGQGFYSHKEDDYQWYYEQPRYTNPDLPNSVVSTVLSSGGTPNLLQTVSENNVDFRNNWRPDYNTTSLSDFKAGVKYQIGGLKLDFYGYAAIAREVDSEFAFDPIARASVTSTIGSGPAAVSFFNGFSPTNPAEYVGIGADGPINQPSIGKVEAASFKGSYDTGNSWVSELEFGARFATETNAEFPNSLIVSAQTLAGLVGEAYNPTVEGGSFDAAPFLASKTFNFFGQSITTLGANTNALLAKVPLSKIIASTPITYDLAGTYTIKEQDNAGYVRADFQVPSFPIKGNVGVRFVSTEETASGYSPDLSSIEYNAQGSTTVIPNVTPVSDKHSYNNLLPNLNLTYSVTPKILVRFGVAETMTRPDLSQLAPNTTVNAGVQSIAEGNPDLKPYTALQYDLSAEWYFAKTGLISVALFDKQVKNFIQNGSFTETLNVKVVQGGGTIALPFSVAEPENSTTPTTVKGVEFGYQQGFTFLPAPFDGLGALFNYTYITADPIVVTAGTPAVPLSGLSNNNYNLVGYYEKGKVGVRLAYNYRGNYVVDPTSYFGDGDYRKAYGQLDVSGTFHLTSQLDLTAEALNVTNNPIVDVDKYGINRGYQEFGTTFMLGAHYKFR